MAGRTADNGRYLLLERTENERSGLHFLARDQFCGLEVVVTLGGQGGTGLALPVRGVQLAQGGPCLPLLCSAEDLEGGRPASELEREGGKSGVFPRLWRSLLARLGLLAAARLDDHR